MKLFLTNLYWLALLLLVASVAADGADLVSLQKRQTCQKNIERTGGTNVYTCTIDADDTYVRCASDKTVKWEPDHRDGRVQLGPMHYLPSS